MANADPPLMQIRDLRFGYTPDNSFLGPINLEIHRERLLAVVGPNGAGKSTLLRLMAGLTRPNAGEILFQQTPLTDISPRDRARHITFLPQKPIAPPSTSAFEIVSLGRHPHRSLGLFESPIDTLAIERAMDQTKTTPFADRRMDTLSGGEAQRVHLAAALAQQPELLILDEPTAELDLLHQLQSFHLLRDLTKREKLATVVVTHDLNLASRFADDVVLLRSGEVAASGPAKTVLAPQQLEAVYGVKFETAQCANQRWLLAQDPVKAFDTEHSTR